MYACSWIEDHRKTESASSLLAGFNAPWKVPCWIHLLHLPGMFVPFPSLPFPRTCMLGIVVPLIKRKRKRSRWNRRCSSVFRYYLLAERSKERKSKATNKHLSSRVVVYTAAAYLACKHMTRSLLLPTNSRLCHWWKREVLVDALHAFPGSIIVIYAVQRTSWITWHVMSDVTYAHHVVERKTSMFVPFNQVRNAYHSRMSTRVQWWRGTKMLQSPNMRCGVTDSDLAQNMKILRRRRNSKGNQWGLGCPCMALTSSLSPLVTETHNFGSTHKTWR